MIVPSIGRVMWYHPQNSIANMTQHDSKQPMIGHVCYVWNENMVNLLVIDHNGKRHERTSVPVVQDGSPYTVGDSPYVEWMPYQIGQAAKAT